MTEARQRQISLKETDYYHRTTRKPRRACLKYRHLMTATSMTLRHCPSPSSNPMDAFAGMCRKFGQTQVSNGLANCITKDQASAAHKFVDNMCIPQAVKDNFHKNIDSWEQQNTKCCSSECQEQCDALYEKVMDAANEPVLYKGGDVISGGGVHQSQLPSRAGGSCPAPAPAAGSCPANGGTQTQGGGGSFINSVLKQSSNAMGEAGKSQDDKDAEAGGKNSKGTTGGNWLVELAKAMAEIQNKFLTAAMANKETMVANSEGMTESDSLAKGKGAAGAANGQGANGATGETVKASKGAGAANGQTNANGTTDDPKAAKRKEFLEAQAEFQANTQMFNNIANMTATTLKTLGEALTGLSRKQ